jgi:DNA-binding NarL/FixJ family response regulator
VARKTSAKRISAAVASQAAKAGTRKRMAEDGPRRKGPKRTGRKVVPAQKRPRGLKVHLTERELQVFRLLSLGCTVKEAAAILKVAPSTADNHKARLMAKLGTDKSALVTRLAIKTGVSSMQDRLTPMEKRRSGRKQDGWN